MNTRLESIRPGGLTGRTRCRRGERGSAILVVFVLMTVMLIFTVANTRSLYYLKAELRLIEKRQVQKYKPVAASLKERPTNAPPAKSP